ncbi:MAG: sigma-54-dependent Fis family transcriptional regulator [Proteobacteria bacterium]|nr:sigma-54-dependent Fis family transcriptional regulator [Pseudomonadota bacterium]
MQDQSRRVCIVTRNPELGAAVRNMVLSTDQYACTVVSSIECLQSLVNDESIEVIFLDRAVDAEDFDKHATLLERYAVATFGKPVGESTLLDAIEASADYQMRDPLETLDLRRLFNQIDKSNQGMRPTDSDRPLHLYRGLVGESESVQALKTLIAQVAPSRANVLILGETGTGKEVVARNIHYRSANNGGPFVPINCSAIPADLLESELFGHKKGAFTGAISDRVGRFELASDGTVFLDEIGDMPIDLQVKLLRVLEERIIYPLGADSAVPMTARVVAATHRDLEKLVEKGIFREDLYYRLNVFPIVVPALRDRKEDIPQLAHELSCRLRQDQNVTVEFSRAATDRMQQYGWPGNVRELANLVERLAVLHPNDCVDLDDLPANIRATVDSADAPLKQADSPLAGLTDGFDLKAYLELTEASLIEEALQTSGGVVTQAAKMLHVRRTTLTEKVKRLGLSEMVRHAS